MEEEKQKEKRKIKRSDREAFTRVRNSDIFILYFLRFPRSCLTFL